MVSTVFGQPLPVFKTVLLTTFTTESSGSTTQESYGGEASTSRAGFSSVKKRRFGATHPATRPDFGDWEIDARREPLRALDSRSPPPGTPATLRHLAAPPPQRRIQWTFCGLRDNYRPEVDKVGS